jgi:outer membrane protein assembly factor BamA
MGKFSVILFFVLVVHPVFLFAQRETAAGSITSIEVTGLRRTRTTVTDHALRRFIGRDAESLDINEVKAAIIDTGVLEPVSVELLPEDGGTGLFVRVEEKWALFPIPLILANSGGTNFGLFLADTNAFGLRDQAAVGGMYGSDGWMGMALYRNTPERNNFPGWNTAFMYSSRKKEDQNKKEQTLRSYDAAFLRVSFGLEYPVTGKLTLLFTFSFTEIAVSNPMLNAPEEGNRSIGFSPGIAYRSSRWDGYLLSEQSLSLSYGYMPAFVGSSFHELDMRFVFAIPVVPGFLASLKGGANIKPGAGRVFEDGPRGIGIDILPAKFSALHYAGAQAGFEKYLFKTRLGTLSAFISWQAVFSSGSLLGETFDHGPAGGLCFYLSRVAIPALGFTAAYNMTTSLPQFSFSIGMGF